MVEFLGLIWQEFEFSLLNIDGFCVNLLFFGYEGFCGILTL